MASVAKAGGITKGDLDTEERLCFISPISRQFEVQVERVTSHRSEGEERTFALAPHPALGFSRSNWQTVAAWQPLLSGAVRTDAYGRPWMVHEAPYQNGGFRSSFSFSCGIKARELRLADARGSLPKLPRVELDLPKFWLYESRNVDLSSSVVQAFIRDKKLSRASVVSNCRFAAEALEVVRKLRYSTNQQAQLVASEVVSQGIGTCGGLVNVYVAVLRANGVPARQVVGLAVNPDKPTQALLHAVAEFHTTTMGWLPVDVAKAADEAVRDAATFVGNDPGWFIGLYYGDEVILDEEATWLEGFPPMTMEVGEVGGIIHRRFGDIAGPSSTQLKLATKLRKSPGKGERTALFK